MLQPPPLHSAYSMFLPWLFHQGSSPPELRKDLADVQAVGWQVGYLEARQRHSRRSGSEGHRHQGQLGQQHSARTPQRMHRCI